MTYCPVSNQIAWNAHKAPVQSFGDYSEADQELIVSELAEAVLNDNASLTWVEYPHTITADFARDTALEDADFINELSNAVLNTANARSLLLLQIKCTAKGLIRYALDETGNAPEGYDFEALLLEDAA